MGLIKPSAAHFTLAEFRELPYHERVRLTCVDWVHIGFGAPSGGYAFYLLKIALYVGGWYAFVRAGGVEGPFREWWNSPVAFAKGIVWTLLFESLGFGCGSGALTGRYFPPVAAFLHFLRPGTIRLPPFPSLPMTAGTQRTIADAALYAVYIAVTVRVLLSDAVTAGLLLPIILTLVVLGLRDKTVFLAARSEHYLTTIAVLMVLDSPLTAGTTWAMVPIGAIAGAKAVQLAIWWWAATSKLNRHFPYVVGVMLTNHPLIRAQGLRRRMVRHYPDDLRPGAIPHLAAHGGTVIEYLVPLLLVVSSGGAGTRIGLAIMVGFHLWIFSSFALGVPQEWNVFFIYATLVLFGGDLTATITPWQLGDDYLWVLLIVALVVVPVVGNLVPSRVSFLTSMRYYSGNWGTTAWMFTPEALARFDTAIPKVAKEIATQLKMFYDDDTVEVTATRVGSFRAMHLHGRLVQRLITRSVEDPDDYVIRDGELVAGMALGWNFGEMHLHHEQLLTAVQDLCDFKPGELRVAMIESQPFLQPRWEWRIVDAADGELLSGTATVAEALGQQPWPDALPWTPVKPAMHEPAPGPSIPVPPS